MGLTSNTGLFPAQNILKSVPEAKKINLQLQCEVTPAPFTLRPYAGLYNPFSPTCSILCNHPAHPEAKEFVKNVKTEWVHENKYALSHEELKSSFDTDDDGRPKSIQDLYTEDMFRRYTQTDSRPHTPALTLASGKSKTSRRCLTPDQQPKRTTIVVDLRRSHSQETVFYHGFVSDSTSVQGASTIETTTLPYAHLNLDLKDKELSDNREYLPPLTSPATLTKRSQDSIGKARKKDQLKALYSKKSKKSRGKQKPSTHRSTEPQSLADGNEGSTKEEDTPDGEVRRRGKRRKKKGLGGRLPSALLIAQTSVDPETQVAGIETDSQNPSSRGSIAPANGEPLLILPALKVESYPRKLSSFLDDEILKYLHREVDQDAVEKEFDPKRRYVLQEALRTKPPRVLSEEVQKTIEDLNVPKCCLNDWLHVPRVFSRKNARFSLPIDTTFLQCLSPMQYLAQYVNVTKSKQLLYLTVSQQFKPESYKMPIKNISEGLKLMMGGTLTDDNSEYLRKLLAWDRYIEDVNCPHEVRFKYMYKEDEAQSDRDQTSDEEGEAIKHKTWCGVCAICERMYGNFKPREVDQPDGMELSDFSMLETKLATMHVDPSLAEILNIIRTA